MDTPVAYDLVHGDGASARLAAAEAQVAHHLAAAYGFETSREVRLGTGVRRHETRDGESWIVRISAPGRNLRQVEIDATVLRGLERSDVAAERCAHADPVSSLAGLGVLVTREVKGAPVQPTPGSLERLGRFLGWLHARPEAWSRGIDRPAGALHQLCPNGGLPARHLSLARTWLKGARTERPQARRAYGIVAGTLSQADDCADLPEGFVHPDFWHGNVVEAPDGTLTAIDWTGAGRGPRLRSLATLLWLGATRHTGGPRLDLAEAAAGGYRDHVRLTRDEIDRLPGAMLNPVAALAALQLRLGAVSTAVELAGPATLDMVRRTVDAVRPVLSGGDNGGS